MVDAQLNMNLFDVIVFGVIVLCCMLSFFRGFIRELLSLLAWVGASFITLYCVMDVAALIQPYVKKPVIAAIFASLGTYFVALMVISILTSILLKYLKAGSEVGSLDHVLGLAFGFLKGSLIICLGYFLMSLVMNKEDYPAWMKTAITLPYVEKGTAVMVKMMPDYLKGITTMAEKAKDGEPINLDDPLIGRSTKPADGSDDQKSLESIFNGFGEPAGETPPNAPATPAPTRNIP